MKTFTMIYRLYRRLMNKLYYTFVEKKKFGCKYLHFRNNSDNLFIVFSAFPPTNKRIYNYVKSFANIDLDRLYINDTWGYKGSYYIYEKGTDKPYNTVMTLINYMQYKYKYKNIYTAGTSKGGVAALIFGLKFKAIDIFSGACQYYIGDYLATEAHSKIFKAMMDTSIHDEKARIKLNDFVPSIIRENSKITNGRIHIIYSRKDHTTQDHIYYLIKDLELYDYNVKKVECFFDTHDAVGPDFAKYVNNYLLK